MRLVHIGGGDAFDVASERALKWAWRVPEPIPDLEKAPSGRAGTDTDGRGVGVWWSSALSSSARALEVRLKHPDSDDPTLHWQGIVTISELDGATQATIRLGLGATVHALVPWQIELSAPQVVRQLMQSPLLAYAGSMELASGPRNLRRNDVKAFIANVLEADDRALPLLVASSDVDGRLLEAMDRRLAGLVQIVQLADSDGDEEMRARLSRSGFTVPRGGLRLFWPGFGRRIKRRRHPYWTAAQLRVGRRNRARSVLGQLMDLLAPISTGRVPTDSVVLKARQAWLEDRAAERDARDKAMRERARRQRIEAQRAKREAREAGKGTEKQLEERTNEVEALLDIAENERDAALEEAKKSKQDELKAIREALDHSERVKALESENSNLRDNIETMSRFGEGREELEADDDESVPVELRSWPEIASHLPDLEGPGFHFTDRARECADGKSRYPHPDVIWSSLRALERVGRIFNEMGADLNMQFEQFAMECASLDVALHDNTYEDCWFEYEGEWYKRLPHVKIDDAKSPNEVGRIYFALDGEGKRVIVDWFGTKPDRPLTKRTG
jgi:hypothetical protein